MRIPGVRLRALGPQHPLRRGCHPVPGAGAGTRPPLEPGGAGADRVDTEFVGSPRQVTRQMEQPRSSFPSCRKRSSRPTTSPPRPSSPLPCWPSSTATTRPPGHSTGSSPPPTWPGCSSGSALAMNPPACHTLPDDPTSLRSRPEPGATSRAPRHAGSAHRAGPGGQRNPVRTLADRPCHGRHRRDPRALTATITGPRGPWH
jgi:hypothetical protein